MTEVAAISYETAFIMRRTVEAADIDVLGHVNNAVYVQWLQDIAVAHWHQHAQPDLFEKFVWVCRRHEIDYRAQLVEGEDVELRTWLGALSGPKFDRHVDIRKVGSPQWSVLAKTTWVMVDSTTRKPLRVPGEVLSAFGVE